MRIVIADLGDIQVTISSDVYVLGIANLAVFAQSRVKSMESLEFTFIREPQDLKRVVDNGPPKILGLCSHAWNHDLANHFAEYAKSRSPNTIILMGGPNFPLTAAEQEAFLRILPAVDIAFQGLTYEGEREFAKIIQCYVDNGKSIAGLQESEVPGNIWTDKMTGGSACGNEPERIQDLDEIPSPYLAGLPDPFFETGISR